jgi:hypothetical protein
MLTGGCFCGFVRYAVNGAPFNEANCHCSICRRTSGAPFVAWFSVRRDEFQFLEGEPARFASSDYAQRTFCPRCGTPMTFQSSRFPTEIDITICSLDEPAHVAPKHHIYTSTQLPWIRLADNLPMWPESRSS